MEAYNSNQPVYKKLYSKVCAFLENNPFNQWCTGVIVALGLSVVIMGISPALLGGLGLMAGYRIRALRD